MRNRPPLADCAIAYLLWLRTVPNDYFDWVDVNIHWRSSALFRKSCPSLNTCMGLRVFFGQKAISQFLHKQKSRSPMKAFDTFDSFLPLFYAIVLLILCFLILFSQLFLFFFILIHLFFPYFLAWTCAKWQCWFRRSSGVHTSHPFVIAKRIIQIPSKRGLLLFDNTATALQRLVIEQTVESSMLYSGNVGLSLWSQFWAEFSA